jgi:hypothetical protein
VTRVTAADVEARDFEATLADRDDDLTVHDLPTVVEHYDGPDMPRCPDCGQYPDRYRATCLTCLRGEHHG